VKKKILVLGLGNPLMADEGVGCRIIERFLTQAVKYPNIDFIDAGTGGMSILHLIADRQKVILVDCAYMGARPGTVKRFTPEDVQSTKKLAHLSLHEIDILKVIELAKQLGQCPDEIVIFGVEPETIEQRQSLSETILQKFDDYVAEISAEFSSCRAIE
jgi:hydrogenase maturation protease